MNTEPILQATIMVDRIVLMSGEQLRALRDPRVPDSYWRGPSEMTHFFERGRILLLEREANPIYPIRTEDWYVILDTSVGALVSSWEALHLDGAINLIHWYKGEA